MFASGSMQDKGHHGHADIVSLDCPCEDDVCSHVHTHRHARSRTPWCNDYLFTTRVLGRRVTGCAVDEDSFTRSDHGAVVVDVEP